MQRCMCIQAASLQIILMDHEGHNTGGWGVMRTVNLRGSHLSYLRRFLNYSIRCRSVQISFEDSFMSPKAEHLRCRRLHLSEGDLLHCAYAC
jgi:hypothetical protein